MKKQRRQRAERVPVNLATCYEWGLHKEDGVIKDISANGCFIASEVDVAIGDAITIPVHAPGLLHMRVLGVVVRKVAGGGFAVRFVRLSVTDRTLLSRFVEHVLKGHASSAGVASEEGRP